MWKYLRSLFAFNSDTTLHRNQQLARLLNEAKNEALNQNLDIMAYATVQDFDDFLNNCIKTLKNNQNLDFYQYLELIGIFYPTGEWDYAHGSEDIANRITSIIESINDYDKFANQILI